MSSPRAKRQKFFDIKPGIFSGAWSASDSSKFRDGVAQTFNITSARNNIMEFFDEPTLSHRDISANRSPIDVLYENIRAHTVSGFFMGSAKFALTENMYRNVLYRMLTNRKTHCLVTPSETRAKNAYKEIDLRGIFSSFLREEESQFTDHNEHATLQGSEIERLQYGLKVAFSSAPDLVFFRRADGYLDVKIGEIKHSGVYTKHNAEQQATVYLYGLLYFLRVKLGLKVGTVYGFAVCGNKCDGHGGVFSRSETYAVGFVRLSTPVTLGGEFVATSYWKDYPNSNPEGYQLLIHYLKEGKSSTLQWNGRHPMNKRCPSLFTVPAKFWEDTAERELVTNGTSSAVFKVTNGKDGVRSLFNQTNSGAPYHEHTVGRFNECLDNAAVDGTLYVKVQSKETAIVFDHSKFYLMWHSVNSRNATRNHDAFADFLQTYPVEPPVFIGFTFICMRDRGTSIVSPGCLDMFSDFAAAKPGLADLKKRIDGMGSVCFHGDVLPHNTVVDRDGNFVLIDYDESFSIEADAPRRKYDEVSKDWQFLAYPNALRGEKKLFTALQFASIVLCVHDALKRSSDGDLQGEDSTDEDLERVNLITKKLQNLVPGLRDADEQETKSLRSLIPLEGLVSVAKEVDEEVTALLKQLFREVCVAANADILHKEKLVCRLWCLTKRK